MQQIETVAKRKAEAKRQRQIEEYEEEQKILA